MGYKNRELEVKLLASTDKYKLVCERILASIVNMDFECLIGKATDLYWPAPEAGGADFVRLRRRANGSSDGQITLKSTDRGDIVNRVEIDLEVDNYTQAKVLMTTLHGKETASVTKRYTVYFLEDRDTNISVYQITGDKRVFLEVEAKTVKRLKELLDIVYSSDHDLIRVKSSVYNMFVQKKEMETESLKQFLQNL
jgi:adenylate cyclase class IV